jgi:hypothetical protein
MISTMVVSMSPGPIDATSHYQNAEMLPEPLTAAPLPSRGPRIAVVLSEAKIRQCETSETGTALLTRPDVRLVPHQGVDPNDDALTQLLIESDLLQAGLVLLRSPYDHSSYADVEVACTQFALEKCMILSRFCQLLGAVRISVTDETAHVGRKQRRLTTKGGMEKGGIGVTGSLGCADDLLETIKQALTLEDVFVGNGADVAGATDFLREVHLLGDPAMRALLIARRPTENPIKTRHLRLDLSRESQHLFEIVAELSLPEFLGIRADVTLIAVESSSVQASVDLEVQFP